MKKYKLLFWLKVGFGEDIKILVNNDRDLTEYLKSLGCTEITYYTDCTFDVEYKDKLGHKELVKLEWVEDLS